MNIVRRIFSAIFWYDIVGAFRIHPLSATISLFTTVLLIADIMNFASITIKWRFFTLISFCIALGVEALYVANARNCTKWQIAKFATFALIATAIYFYIAQNMENIASPTHIATPTFYLHYYALCVIFTLIFVALHLGQSFRSLYNSTIRMVFLCAVCGLFSVLLLIFALLCDTLFGVSIYRFAISVEICALEAIFLLFLATFKYDIEVNFSIILRILNVFATLYLTVFLLYFISVFVLGVKPRVSIVHLVVWYSFFALFLWWLNMAKIGESLGESTPKINRILMQFAPLGTLFVLNIIAFYAIILRIVQYGITPERYFVVVGCVALLVNLAFSAFCKKPIAKGIVSIIILVAFSAFGWKFNAIDLSLNSQYKELYEARNSGDSERIKNIESFIMRYNSNFMPSAYTIFMSDKSEINIDATFDDALYTLPLESRYKAILQVDCCVYKARENGGYFYDINNGDLQIFKDSKVVATIDLLDLSLLAKERYESGDNGIIRINGTTVMIRTLSVVIAQQSVTVIHLSGNILIEK